MAADPRIVLVPGGFTGAWMWADVVALLRRDGVETIAVELPTIGEDGAGMDFYTDAQAVRELLDRLEPPVVLCGHSYGGAVITEAAALEVVELPTGHCPNWSRPDLVAGLLMERARSMRSASAQVGSELNSHGARS